MDKGKETLSRLPRGRPRGRTAKVLGILEPFRLLAGLGVAQAGHHGIRTGAWPEPFLQRNGLAGWLAGSSEVTETVAFRLPSRACLPVFFFFPIFKRRRAPEAALDVGTYPILYPKTHRRGVADRIGGRNRTCVHCQLQSITQPRLIVLSAAGCQHHWHRRKIMSTLSRNRLLFRMGTSGPSPGVLTITIATTTTDAGPCVSTPWVSRQRPKTEQRAP